MHIPHAVGHHGRREWKNLDNGTCGLKGGVLGRWQEGHTPAQPMLMRSLKVVFDTISNTRCDNASRRRRFVSRRFFEGSWCMQLDYTGPMPHSSKYVAPHKPTMANQPMDDVHIPAHHCQTRLVNKKSPCPSWTDLRVLDEEILVFNLRNESQAELGWSAAMMLWTLELFQQLTSRQISRSTVRRVSI